MDSSDRDSEPMGPRAIELDGGPDEAAYEKARVTCSPARVGNPYDRLSEPLDIPQVASCMYDFDGG